MTDTVMALALILLGAALMAALVALVLGYRSVRRSSRAVREMTEGARQLATGNLEYRIPGQGSREIRELAEALNHLAGVLAGNFQDFSRERDQLVAVLETMTDGVAVTDPQGTILVLNQAARGLLKVEDPDPRGRRLIEVTREHQVHRLVSACLSTGQAQSGTVELVRPRRYLTALASPLPLGRPENEQSLGVLLTLRDLTRSRQMETSQREFVSNVSHELRNPLASVKALVETLEDGAIEQPQMALDLLHRIHQDIDRMNSLVNELLELSRLESGHLALDLKPLDLTAILADVKSRFEPVAKEGGLAIVLAVPDDLPRVMADEDRVRQVLINLLENALKFTPPGGQVRLGAQWKDMTPRGTGEYRDAGRAGVVEVTVEDTGTGIAPDDLPHLFERFYKVDRSRHAGGTGLGLAIVKQIVEAHSGEIRVESREGAGSTFAFTLRVAGC